MLLDYTIHVILQRIYTEREIETNITKKKLKDPLILCTKNVHFSFNGQLYLQKDGIAMGWLLGPVIAGIFMVELERNLLPTLSQYMISWKQYVDDTVSYVKVDCIEHVLNALNSFHANITFTYEQECYGMISFLDVLIMRKNNTIESTAYHKQTHNDIYLHWESFTPEVWKHVTLKTLLFRAHTTGSNKELLEEEVKHLKHVFITINGFPLWVVSQVINRVENEVFTT